MLVSALVKYGCSNSDLGKEPKDVEQEVVSGYSSILDQYDQRKRHASTLPSFYKPKGKGQSLGSMVRREAKRRQEQDMLLSEEDLRQIWYLMEEVGSCPEGAEEVRINYDGFSQVLAKCREVFGPQVGAFFKASTFLKFECNASGRISANQFLSYLNLQMTMRQIRQALSAHDPDDAGSLTTAQLEEYLRTLPGKATLLADLQPTFLDNYVRIAARKLLLLHGKDGRLQLRDLANSSTMQELIELKDNLLKEDQLLHNWFSLQSTQRVHKTFIALDEDMNGLLSKTEFSAISNGTMSPLFIQRIFEEHVMRSRVVQGRTAHRDEMDLVEFTDFVLAWDHRSHPAAIKYFFDIFDLKKQGYITPIELYVFFKEIHHMWVHVLHEYADLAIYDVVDEILDMIKPKVTACITAEDLAASGQSGDFFAMLSDVKKFHDYNYREQNVQLPW